MKSDDEFACFCNVLENRIDTLQALLKADSIMNMNSLKDVDSTGVLDYQPTVDSLYKQNRQTRSTIKKWKEFQQRSMRADDQLRYVSCRILASRSENIFGWLLTAIAISFGAPFWFDLLNKFVRLRTSVPQPNPKSDTSNTGPSTGTSTQTDEAIPASKRHG